MRYSYFGLFIVVIFSSLSIIAFASAESIPSETIPEWVKNNAGWWADGDIPDSAFIAGIEYLIIHEIIVVSITESQSENGIKIPEWIKTNAGWWADGQIPDSAFIDGIQYLIKDGIIQIESTEKIYAEKFYDWIVREIRGPESSKKIHNEIVNNHNLTYTEQFVLMDRNKSWIAGYRGATFDGESVYFAPYYNNYDRKFGLVIKYNIDSPFDDPNSWDVFSLTQTGNGGFQGVLYHDGFVWYVPYVMEKDKQTKFVRYDTSKEFDDYIAWSYTPVGNVGAFEDGVVANNFIYYSPHYDQDFERFAKPLRMDTTAETASKAYVQYISELKISYIGASFDGNFIYYAPYESDYQDETIILIYDISKEFDDSSSWTEITIPYTQLSGAGFNGKEIVMAPHCYLNEDMVEMCPKILFLDVETQEVRYSDKSYGSYNGVIEADDKIFLVPYMTENERSDFLMIKDGIHSFSPSIAKGAYWGGTYDGRHVYYTPYNFFESPTTRSGEFLRYDTTKNFDDELAWEIVSFAVTDFDYDYGFDVNECERMELLCPEQTVSPEEYSKFK